LECGCSEKKKKRKQEINCGRTPLHPVGEAAGYGKDYYRLIGDFEIMDAVLYEKKRFNKIGVALLAIPILILAQIVAVGIGKLSVMMGVHVAICNVIMGVIYVGISLAGLVLLCRKGLGISPEECGITKPKLKVLWVVAGILMPLSVIGILFLIPGTWINSWKTENMDISMIFGILTGAICYFGFATGVVEEAVFRGVIMTALERKWNRRIAVLVPSMIFGLLHVIGNDLDFISTLQLFVAGTFVGILFSLVTYESKSIWCSSFMHGIWNIFMCTGILNIGVETDSGCLFNYVLDTKSFLISGGDFGIEASIVSVFVYIFFSGLALILCKKRFR